MSSTTVVSRQAGVSPLQVRRVRKTVGSWLGFLPLVLASVVIIAPVLWTVSTSLRTPAQSFTVPPQWLPLHPVWSNYQAVFQTVPYGSYHTHGFMSRVDGGPGLHVPFHHIAGT